MQMYDGRSAGTRKQISDFKRLEENTVVLS